MDPAVVQLDLCAFRDALERVIGILHTHAARNVPVLCDGIFQQISHHRVAVNGIILMRGEIAVNFRERLGAVVVVGVDDGERRINDMARRQHRVGGSPRLCAALRDGIALRQIVQLLEYVTHLHHLGDTVPDRLPERLLNLVLDDEYHRLEARAPGVVQGIVDDDLSVVPHRIDLFQASVAAAHSGGHHDKDRFFIHKNPS